VEINWSTYLLEVINFLILVWILKRFFYQPVLDMIARRRQAVEKTTADAAATRHEAEQLKKQFEGRLTDWEHEKQQARTTLAQEIADERRRRLDDVETELAGVRERAKVQGERQLAALLEAREREALALATRFTSRLLERVASPDLESRLISAGLDDLRALPPETRDAIGQALRAAESATVTSAYPLADDGRERVQQALAKVAGQPVACRFQTDTALLAGLRIAAGPWSLGANLHDELEGFGSVGRDGQQP
jgi:F-type H+-transporting ATPase subunit b